ncbi:phage tail protein [Kitasatospora purpeofusca]|uniref:phage tail protein n=1 Tax=Kitasatospora purpeofusca TaxID=67352 RepID=UPI0036CF500E
MLEKYSKLKIQLNLDTGDAAARIQELARDRRVNIEVDADTAEAAARIAALARDRRVVLDVDADTAGADRTVNAFIRRNWRWGIPLHVTRRSFEKVKGAVREIGQGFKTLGQGFGQLFTLSIGNTISGLQTMGDGLKQIGSNALQAAAGFAQMGLAVAPVLVAVMALATWVAVVASGLIGVIALAALPVLPIGLAAIVAAGNMKDLGKAAEEGMLKVSEALKPATAAIREQLGGAVKQVTTWFAEAEPKIKAFFDSGAQFVRPMVDSILKFTDVLFPKLTEAMNSAGMKAFTDELPNALVRIGQTLGDFFVTLADGGDRLKLILEPLNNVLNEFMQGIADLAVQFSPEIAQSIQWFADSVREFFNIFRDNAEATAALMRLVDLTLRALVLSIGVVMATWDLLAVAAVALWHALQAAWDGIVAGTKAAWSAVTETVSSCWNSIYATVSGWIGTTVDAVASAWRSVVEWTTSTWASVTSAVSDAWNSIYSTVSSWIGNTVDAVASAWRSVVEWTRSTFNDAKQAVSDAMSSIKDAVSTGVQNVISFFAELPGKIIGAIGDLGSMLYEKGKSAVQGLINGLKSIDVGSVASGILGALNPFSSPTGPVVELPPGAMPVALGYARSPVDDVFKPLAASAAALPAHAYGRRAAAGLGQGSHRSLVGNPTSAPQITVNARTEADPYEIGKQIAWELKTSGR